MKGLELMGLSGIVGKIMGFKERAKMQKKISNGTKCNIQNFCTTWLDLPSRMGLKFSDGMAISRQGMVKHGLGSLWVKLRSVIGQRVAGFCL